MTDIKTQLDIVEKLRPSFLEYGTPKDVKQVLDIMKEAAAEIERLRAALASEREACAQVLLQEAKDLADGPGYWEEEIDDYKRLADLIRARS